jgi:hypothetical protein
MGAMQGSGLWSGAGSLGRGGASGMRAGAVREQGNRADAGDALGAEERIERTMRMVDLRKGRLYLAFGPTLAGGPAFSAWTFSRNPGRDVRRFGRKLGLKIDDSERNKSNWG